jgi:hypothetical protein
MWRLDGQGLKNILCTFCSVIIKKKIYMIWTHIPNNYFYRIHFNITRYECLDFPSDFPYSYFSDIFFIYKMRTTCYIHTIHVIYTIYFVICPNYYVTMLVLQVIILYNVRVLDHFWPPVVRVSIFETPFRLLIRFIYNLTHVTTVTHNYSLRFCAFTQLAILHVNIPFSHNLHNTLQIKPSHFETLAENWLREFTS